MEIRNEINYLKNTKCQDVTAETGAEYLLPDYNGDVRRILYTSATPRPSGSFVGDGNVEYSGIVVYDVVYLDGDGVLSSVSFTSDYDYTVRCPEGELAESYANTRVANFAVRLLSPRKISAKASVVATPHLVTSHTHALQGSAFSDGREPEVLTRVANLRKSRLTETVEREYAESILRLDGTIADEVSVIHASADPVIESVSRSGEELDLTGYITVSLLVRVGDEPAYREEKRIPFEESVSLPEGCTAELITPYLTVPSLTTTVNADDSGSEIVANLIAEAHVLCDTSLPVELVADAYLTDFDTENSYTDLRYTELLDKRSVTETLSFDFPRDSEELAAIREVLVTDAQPRISSVTSEDGTTVAHGDMRITGVVSTAADGGEVSYAPLKLECDFKLAIPIPEAASPCESVELRLTPHLPRVTLSADRISVSAPVSVDATLTADRSLRILDSSEITSPATGLRDGATVTVYYPTDGDTLYEIARRYRTTAARIASANALTVGTGALSPSDSLAGLRRIIIP